MDAARYVIGAISVEVLCEVPAVFPLLDLVYDRASSDTDPHWSVRCRVEPDGWSVDNPSAARAVEEATQERRRTVGVVARTVIDASVAVRRLVRQLYLDHCEQSGFTMLHASAISRNGTVLIFVGDKGAGKTTLALDGIFRHDFRLLSNDYLVVMADDDGCQLTTIPTFVPVKLGTAMWLEDCLPSEHASGRLDLSHYRGDDPDMAQLVAYYSFAQLGQVRHPSLTLDPDSPGTYIIFPRFGPASAPFDAMNSAKLGAALVEHHRADWVYSDQFNPSWLPRHRRSRPQFIRDTRIACAHLAGRSSGFSWSHDGSLSPLLSALCLE